MASQSPSSLAGSKRKRSGPKYYAVRIGNKPGVYSTWNECLQQVKGFPHATFKSFTTQSEAESFVSNDPIKRQTVNATEKYYAVQVGRVPGVYSTYDEIKPHISGWPKARFKSFTTRAEAEAFVKQGHRENGVKDSPEIKDSSPKPPSKKQKRKNNAPELEVPELDEGEYEAGEGPLPPDTEDGFDPRIQLDSDTGKVQYKTDEQMQATKWQASQPVNDGILRIYTDGSSLGNGARGATAGVGVYFGPKDRRNLSEALHGPRQTNQRAELTAILRALELSPRDRPLQICTDSSYAIKCVTEWFQKWRSNGWLNAAKKPVENKDLIEKILGMLEEREKLSRKYAEHHEEDDFGGVIGGRKGRSRVEFVWVKGHSTDPGNIASDQLAVSGAHDARTADS